MTSRRGGVRGPRTLVAPIAAVGGVYVTRDGDGARDAVPVVRHATASAIVFDGTGRVLLVEHRKAGLWLYPGGHVEPDEAPAEAAVREVAEETGLAVEVVAESRFSHPAVTSHPVPFAIIEMAVTDAANGAHHHIDHVYVCRPPGPADEPRAAPTELAGARWVPIGDVCALRTPAELPSLIAAAATWSQQRRQAET